MSNTALQLVTAAMLAAHLGALVVAAGSRWGDRAVLLVNIATASAVVLYQAPSAVHGSFWNDGQLLALTLFELATLLLAALAWRGRRAALIASYVSFAVNGLACAAAVAFAFTFRMSRLI